MMNGRYRHWKDGRIYTAVGVVLHSETREELVIHKREGDESGVLWVRPLAMWVDEARPGVLRFVRVEDQPEAVSRCYGCGGVVTTRAWFIDRHTGDHWKVQPACASCAYHRGGVTIEPLGTTATTAQPHRIFCGTCGNSPCICSTTPSL